MCYWKGKAKSSREVCAVSVKDKKPLEPVLVLSIDMHKVSTSLEWRNLLM